MCKPELVAPKTETPREKKLLSDIDDQASLRYQLPVLWFYEAKPSMRGVDPATLVRDGLAKALVFYYPLAGRLYEGPNKKLIVDCNGEGVLFVRAEADVNLAKLGRFVQAPCPYLKKLLYHVPGSDGITGTPLLLIQVTRFTCGGFALGVRLNHTMVDAYGIILFLKAVSELARGSTLAPSVAPVWDRELLTAHDSHETSIVRSNNSNTERELQGLYGTSRPPHHKRIFKPLDIERLGALIYDLETHAAMPRFFFFPTGIPVLLQRSFVFGPSEIEALKAQAVAQGHGRCTTFEVVVACLWKCRTIALQPEPSLTVRVTFPTDIRGMSSVTGLSFPRGYYGNAIVMLSASTTAKLLCEGPISYAIKLIREAKGKFDFDYVGSVLDFMVCNGRPRMIVRGNLMVSDTTRIGFEKLDFGWGDALYTGTSTAVYGATFLQNPKSVAAGGAERSILVPLALPHISMLIFKRELKKMTTRAFSKL
ncbi:unnamed protein product [Cuscuta campestris]|uniref:Uncharacterized protein n=1 Tax=Cuscuta campestris TaxID=132261 RepID=A0A484M3I4_9ASTE|nr:unnamed protein product [Cuscuta campestris]